MENEVGEEGFESFGGFLVGAGAAADGVGNFFVGSGGKGSDEGEFLAMFRETALELIEVRAGHGEHVGGLLEEGVGDGLAVEILESGVALRENFLRFGIHLIAWEGGDAGGGDVDVRECGGGFA